MSGAKKNGKNNGKNSLNLSQAEAKEPETEKQVPQLPAKEPETDKKAPKVKSEQTPLKSESDPGTKRPSVKSRAVEKSLTTDFNNVSLQPQLPPTPQSFDRLRPSGKVRDEDKYKDILDEEMKNQVKVEPQAYIIANWGISTEAHDAVRAPSLRQLSIDSCNTTDMGEDLFACCHVRDTDEKGGSVVRYEFSNKPDLHKILRFRAVVEFASKLHNRLVAEYSYKMTNRVAGDEIVVYYACKGGQIGYFIRRF